MGIYHGVYEKPCPRCGGGPVKTTFISAAPMSSHAWCESCGANDFTSAERDGMGTNKAVYVAP